MYPNDAAGLHRSRSYGHSPAPEIHVHNQQFQEHTDRGRPGYVEATYPPPGVSYLPQPIFFERPRPQPIIYEQTLAQPVVHERSRSRSYSKTDEEAVIADYQRRKQKEADEHKQAIESYKLAEAAKKQAEIEARALAIERYKQELKDKEEEDKEAEERVKHKLLEEKAEKKKLDEAYEERMRRDLAKFGFQDNQVKAIVEHKKPEDLRKLAVLPATHHQPVYPIISRKDLSKETLKYYKLPWRYDSDSHEYIVILQEMTTRETDILFEHTKRLRGHTVLTIEPIRGRDGLQNAWVRRRSKSKSGRDRSRGKSPGGESVGRQRLAADLAKAGG